MNYQLYLSKINAKIKSSNSKFINIKCPLCNEGRSPFKTRGYVLLKGEHVTYYCHNCLTEGISFYNFLSQVNNTVAEEFKKEAKKERLYSIKDQEEYKKQIKEVFTELPAELEEPDYIVKPFEKAIYSSGGETLEYPLTEPNEDALIYIYSRGFKKEDIDKYQIKFVKETYDIVFPLWYNQSKNLVYGMQMRSINEKRFHNQLFDVNPKIWNMLYCLSLPKGSRIYISESIIDAISTGFDNIIASLGRTVPSEILELFKDYELVFLFDADEAGDKSCMKYSKLGYKCLLHQTEMYSFKDFNKLLELGQPKQAIQNYIEENVSSPLKCQVQLKLRGI